MKTQNITNNITQCLLSNDNSTTNILIFLSGFPIIVSRFFSDSVNPYKKIIGKI
jgi:hypothetical protein